MIRRKLVGRKPAAWGSLLLLLGAGLLGCTSPDAPSDDSRPASSATASTGQALEFEADLGTMYADVPVLFNPAELSGGAAVDDYERLEFDADQHAPEGLDLTTATGAEVPRLCGAGETCRVADQPKLAPEQAIVATAGPGYEGAAFTLTGQAIDTGGQGTGFSMTVTPEAVEKAPGNVASPTPTPISGGSGEYQLTLDFSEALMVTRPGAKSYITGTYSAEFPAMVLPPEGVVASNHDGDYTANEIFTNTVKGNKPQVSGERGTLAILIDGTEGNVKYSLAEGLALAFPYSDVLDAVSHPVEPRASSATSTATPGT